MWALLNTCEDASVTVYNTEDEALAAAYEYIDRWFGCIVTSREQFVEFQDSLEPTEWLEVVKVEDMRGLTCTNR